MSNLTEEQEKLAQSSVVAWVMLNRFVNEYNRPLEFINHRFMLDYMEDNNPVIVTKKAAQIGMTTCEAVKSFHMSAYRKLNIIHCVDEQTEILTKRGWLKQQDLTTDDFILTLNNDRKSEWLQPNEIVRDNYSGEMIEMKTTQFDALVTPNHRWLVDYRNYKNEKLPKGFVTTDKLGAHDLIPRRAEHISKQDNQLYSDDFIRQLLPTKELTADFITSLSTRQLQILYDTMIKGDGSIHLAKGRNHPQISLTYVSNDNADWFGIMAILLGHGVRYTKRQFKTLTNVVKVNASTHYYADEIHKTKKRIVTGKQIGRAHV